MQGSTTPELTDEEGYRDKAAVRSVILTDGREVEVKACQDTPSGRRLRCRGVRRWVRRSQVVAIRYWPLSIREAARAVWRHERRGKHE